MMVRRRHRLVACSLLLALLVGTGCGESRDRRARAGIHVQRGIEAYGRGDYDRALYSFQRALQFDPDRPETYLYIGQLYDDYLNDNASAITYYDAFLERTQDKELADWVKQWIAKAQADIAIGSEQPVPETPSELEQAFSELQEKYARAITEGRETPAATERPGSQPQLLPWLLAAIFGGLAVAVFVLARFGWLGRRTRVAEAGPSGPVLRPDAVVGRFFWVENEFNLGTVLVAEEDGRLRVESTSLSTNARSIGYGTLDNGVLSTELTDESGLKAPTVFRFAQDGNSFTAEWADDLGPGIAIGVRER
ncbi:MAG: tetratricopeptide repeat protein [Verrucomicrobia bacterium]|nr:tetratricopeptide repeat protein [Verrucomicrobiota bacterium]